MMAFFVDSADCESQLRRKERPMAGGPCHSHYPLSLQHQGGTRGGFRFLYTQAKSRRDAGAPSKKQADLGFAKRSAAARA
jgi:hypothetical protein